MWGRLRLPQWIGTPERNVERFVSMARAGALRGLLCGLRPVIPRAMTAGAWTPHGNPHDSGIRP